MSDRSESDDWDHSVDVLCVGDGPGVLAYGILCAVADFDVLIIESSELDPRTREWLAAMTEDLDDLPADPRLALIHAEPVPPERIDDRTRLEPFVGEDLRRWSQHCLASPFGVVFSEIPDLEPMRTAEGESIVAGVVGSHRCGEDNPGRSLTAWLRERAAGLLAPADDRLDGLIVVDGRIAGVVLRTADGPLRLGTGTGVALSIGAVPAHWPGQPELDGRTVDVAVVGRPAGRFATVGLLAR